VRISGPLRRGIFRARPNRFRAEVEIDGALRAAHVPNSGRLRELLAPGVPCALALRKGEGRVTGCDLVQVLHAGSWVSTDARLPNALVREALEEGRISAFEGWTKLRNEPAYGAGRFDLAVGGPWGEALVEVKSVTLVQDGVARFPDAPTARGARHLRELAGFVAGGGRGVVIFVIQRPDALAFAPHELNDPDFALAVREALAAGVEFLAYTCACDFGEIRVADPIPLNL
jgi:sugar fermentation stimulation protein A